VRVRGVVALRAEAVVVAHLARSADGPVVAALTAPESM
jgi:hypothetical protein